MKFVSPDGGAVPLACIDTCNGEHNAMVYDDDFMWALANTRRPDGVNSADYAALLYIGGSAAMYGVADRANPEASPKVQSVSADVWLIAVNLLAATNEVGER